MRKPEANCYCPRELTDAIKLHGWCTKPSTLQPSNSPLLQVSCHRNTRQLLCTFQPCRKPSPWSHQARIMHQSSSQPSSRYQADYTIRPSHSPHCFQDQAKADITNTEEPLCTFPALGQVRYGLPALR